MPEKLNIKFKYSTAYIQEKISLLKSIIASNTSSLSNRAVFSNEELSNELSNSLVDAIKADNYCFLSNNHDNAIEWLNALLQTPTFYDEWLLTYEKTNKHEKLVQMKMALDLIKDTKGFRKNKFHNLTENQKKQILILNRLVLEKTYTKYPKFQKNDKRSDELIADFIDGSANKWGFCMPKEFRQALDIKFSDSVKDGTKWTQGTSFSFDIGDKIYDTPKAYISWADSLQFINYCLDVTEVNKVDYATIFEPRNPGKVFFDILIPNKEKTKLEKQDEFIVTQDEFVTFLLSGNLPSEIKKKQNK